MHEIYVNSKIDDGSKVSRLMRLFKEENAYDEIEFPATSRRKKLFKETEKGEIIMCDVVKELLQDERQIERQITIFDLVKEKLLAPEIGAGKLGMSLQKFEKEFEKWKKESQEDL